MAKIPETKSEITCRECDDYLGEIGDDIENICESCEAILSLDEER